MGIDRLTMFLSNKWNIKEVLLFPAMRPAENENQPKKPQPAAAQSSLPPLVAKNGVTHTSSPSSAVLSVDTLNLKIEVNGSKLFAGVNLGTSEGLEKVKAALNGKSFFINEAPSKEDALVFEALSRIPNSYLRSTNPVVFRFYSTVSMFSEQSRKSWV